MQMCFIYQYLQEHVLNYDYSNVTGSKDVIKDQSYMDDSRSDNG